MIERGLPEHIETVYEGDFFVWHVVEEEGLVDLRLCPLVEGQPANHDDSYNSVTTVELAAFPPERQPTLAPQYDTGLLHILSVTYENGDQEDLKMVSLRPQPPLEPLTREQLAEADEWAQAILAKRQTYPE